MRVGLNSCGGDKMLDQAYTLWEGAMTPGMCLKIWGQSYDG